MSIGAVHIVKQTNKVPTAAVIALHGSGDSGKNFLEWFKFLLGDNIAFPHIKMYFPTAPIRPYTPNQGQPSNVWIDRYSVTPEVPDHKETLSSIGNELSNFVNKVIEEGIPLNRIIIGGFSMGGATSLHTAYRYKPGFAGVFALSSFINNNSELYSNLKAAKTPLYMCHGDTDSIVPLEWGKKTYEELKKLGVEGEFIHLKNTMHELKKDELKGLFQWITKILPPETS